MQKKSVPSASNAARAAISIGLSTLLRGCKFALAAVAMSLSAACLADTVTFPPTGYDISSAEDWGGTLPGTADIMRFTTIGSRTVTASNDVEFAGLYLGNAGGGVNVTLDMRDSVSGGSPRRIKINGNACVYDGSSSGNLWNTRYTLRGGFWDFGNKTVGINPPDKGYGPSGCSLTIDGGAVVTCGTLLGAAPAWDNDRTASIRIDGEGTVVTSGTFSVSYAGGYRNTATVANGAKVVLTGTGENVLAVDDGNGSRNSLVVTNGSSLTKLNGDKKIIIGRQGKANKLAVYKNSSVTIAGTVYFGHQDNANANSASDNAIVVCETGARLSFGPIYQGNANGVAASAGSSNNVVSVLDGGEVTCGNGGRWYFYGHDNGIVVSNGTMTLPSIKCQTSTNCFVRLQGGHPAFVSNGSYSDYSEFKDGFRFCYELPAEGYGTVEWPYAMSNQAKFLDDTVSVEVEGIGEVRARMKAEGIEAKTINLAKFTNGFATGYGITDAMLARWNEALPEGTKLVLESSGSARLLKLTVKANAPTVVVWR